MFPFPGAKLSPWVRDHAQDTAGGPVIIHIQESEVILTKMGSINTDFFHFTEIFQDGAGSLDDA